MPLRKPAKGESESAWMKFCMGELNSAESQDRPNEQQVAICMSAWRDAHGGEKPSKSVEQMIAEWNAKQITPEGDEDRQEFVDRCMDDEGLDRITCGDIWDNYRSAKNTVHKTHVTPGTGRDYVLSDATIDRFGDVIEAAGWDVRTFEKNPIALFNHNSDFPIGRWSKLRTEKGELRGNLELAREGTSARIDELRSLVDQGILRAVSVGFRPVKHEKLAEKGAGLRYLQQELLECSLVSVPANPNALQVARSLKISDATLKEVFSRTASTTPPTVTRRSPGRLAETSPSVKGKQMSIPLSQRIESAQNYLGQLRTQLDEHLATYTDETVDETVMTITEEINGKIEIAERNLNNLQKAEKQLAQSAVASGTVVERSVGTGESRVVVSGSRPFALPAKKITPVDHLWRGLTVALKHHVEGYKRPIIEILRETYGENDTAEMTRVVMKNMVTRSAVVPADTTTAGWASELVTTAVGEFMASLLPVAIYPKLAALGGSFTFGRNGVIHIPYREASPNVGGAFVLQGGAIPVRQASFNAITLTPKKMGSISTFTREIAEHSTPAIEGLIRRAIVEDTATNIDSVLLDGTAASTTRPAGLRDGVATQTPAGAAMAGIMGDIKLNINALNTGTNGNIRAPRWIMRPGDKLVMATTPDLVGNYVLREELAGGTLFNIPIIESQNCTSDTMYLIDAADFLTATGDSPRFDVSDQAALHMDTAPTNLVSGGTAGSGIVRSMFQTDSIAIRMVLDVNWAMARTGSLSYTTVLGWN